MEEDNQGGRRAAEWAESYRTGDTPWDLGAPHPELSRRLQGGALAPPQAGARALVPGVGRGHDALALARRGWAVVALDLVGSLGDELGAALAQSGGRFCVGDAMDFDDGPFDLIWDHTFFCAINPSDRAAWGARAGDLLQPGGMYAALVFPFGKPMAEGGPPHGMDSAALRQALGARFEAEEDCSAQRKVRSRRWEERWFLARRLPFQVATS